MKIVSASHSKLQMRVLISLGPKVTTYGNSHEEEYFTQSLSRLPHLCGIAAKKSFLQRGHLLSADRRRE
jgi:hypothetical protein